MKPSAAAIVAGLLAMSVASLALGAGAGSSVRIGYLSPDSQSAGGHEPFRSELRRLGYVEGKNISLEYRSAQGRLDRLPALAAELVELRVDVIVSVVTQATIAAKRATSTIPIVMIGVSDPVGSGLVSSLARPGGNVTGTSALAAEVVGKQLELLREALPAATRVAALWNPGNPVFQGQQLAQARAAARRLRMQLQEVAAADADELERAFPAMRERRAEALLVLGDPMFTSNAVRIGRLAREHRLPAFSGSGALAEAGALLTYGPDYADQQQRAARYVDRILKGARPGELAVEQATKFELIVNAGTARALALPIPQSLAVRADRLID